VKWALFASKASEAPLVVTAGQKDTGVGSERPSPIEIGIRQAVDYRLSLR
jgi:hypothetical protein